VMLAGCCAELSGQHGKVSETILIVDVSSVRFRRTMNGKLSLLTADGEMLAELSDPPADDRDAASKVLDVCAATTLVTRAGEHCRVGFYHPGTRQVGVGAHPVWSVYLCTRPLVLPFEGSTFIMTEDTLVGADSAVVAVRDEPLTPDTVLAMVADDIDDVLRFPSRTW
jgi:hypothetical protein